MHLLPPLNIEAKSLTDLRGPYSDSSGFTASSIPGARLSISLGPEAEFL